MPERGYELLFVDKVPFPRRPNRAAAAFPARFRRAIAQVRAHIRDRGVDVVVGFGGYASAPAYVAARGARRARSSCTRPTPSPGMANVLGARRAAGVGVAFEGTPLRGGRVVGMPLRREIVDLDRAALRAEAAAYFGLDAARPTLLVFGGSLGAQRLNEAFGGAVAGRPGRRLAAPPRDRRALDAAPIPGVAGLRGAPVRRPDGPRVRAAPTSSSRARARRRSARSARSASPPCTCPYAVGNGEQALNAGVRRAGRRGDPDPGCRVHRRPRARRRSCRCWRTSTDGRRWRMPRHPSAPATAPRTSSR